MRNGRRGALHGHHENSGACFLCNLRVGASHPLPGRRPCRLQDSVVPVRHGPDLRKRALRLGAAADRRRELRQQRIRCVGGRHLPGDHAAHPAHPPPAPRPAPAGAVPRAVEARDRPAELPPHGARGVDDDTDDPLRLRLLRHGAGQLQRVPGGRLGRGSCDAGALLLGVCHHAHADPVRYRGRHRGRVLASGHEGMVLEFLFYGHLAHCDSCADEFDHRRDRGQRHRAGRPRSGAAPAHAPAQGAGVQALHKEHLRRAGLVQGWQPQRKRDQARDAGRPRGAAAREKRAVQEHAAGAQGRSGVGPVHGPVRVPRHGQIRHHRLAGVLRGGLLSGPAVHSH
mmetsp:Transcript_70463/g.200006  ORF Transcript_70463/g.200006 Transcript_70463/m.200006 type:complete len:341 (-) Transcript_70463:349-1371(-)